MNLLNPILAEIFTRKLREQVQDSGPQLRLEVDELAIWQADQKATGSPQPCPPGVLKVGLFNYGFRKSQVQSKPC